MASTITIGLLMSTYSRLRKILMLNYFRYTSQKWNKWNSRALLLALQALKRLFSKYYDSIQM